MPHNEHGSLVLICVHDALGYPLTTHGFAAAAPLPRCVENAVRHNQLRAEAQEEHLQNGIRVFLPSALPEKKLALTPPMSEAEPLSEFAAGAAYAGYGLLDALLFGSEYRTLLRHEERLSALSLFGVLIFHKNVRHE